MKIFEHEKIEIVLGAHHRDGLNSHSTLNKEITFNNCF